MEIEFFETFTLEEHGCHVCDVVSVERVAFDVVEFNALKILALAEHRRHGCHVRCVEIADVESCQSGASVEHAVHRAHVAGVEAGEVERGQGG